MDLLLALAFVVGLSLLVSFAIIWLLDKSSSGPIKYCDYCGKEFVRWQDESDKGEIRIWTGCPDYRDRVGEGLWDYTRHYARWSSGGTQYNPRTGKKN